jgi:hypothetical protein
MNGDLEEINDSHLKTRNSMENFSDIKNLRTKTLHS